MGEEWGHGVDSVPVAICQGTMWGAEGEVRCRLHSLCGRVLGGTMG